MFAYIIGSQNPVVGKAYVYEISSGSLSIFGENTKYEWYLFKKQKNGSWRDITDTPKLGRSVTYTFHEPVLGNEFELRVFETKSDSITGTGSTKKQIAKLDVVPSHSKTPQIDKVVLLNRGSKDVNKANYRDTLFAQAFCTAMFDQEVEFQLWEDDASGGGHNTVINKNNHHTRTYKARVNEKGIAEVKIPLSGDERILRQIANKYLMKGDKSEGKNHEYYITASYHGKIQKASQVNVDVANPDYKKEQPKQEAPPKYQSPSTPKPPAPKNTPSQPQKPQPKQNTPKFPATKSSSVPRQADAQARIVDAYFVNSAGQKLSKISVENSLQIRISSKNMVGKYIQYVIWEYDAGSNDEIYRSGRIKLSSDLVDTPAITITQTMFKKGIDLWGDPDKNFQNYFIEVLPLDVSAYSKKFGVDSDGLMEVEKVKSAAIVKGQKQENKEEKEKVCECEAKVRAFMRMLRVGEGTENETGYSLIVGGTTFKDHGKDFSDHPKVYIKKYDSTAAGAYQITKTNWNDYAFATWRTKHKVLDFSPESQDKYCVYLIKEKKKALELIKNDDIKGAISKCRTEWASLPGAGYGQREEKIDIIVSKYKQYYQEELKGPTNHLHIKKGFLKDFGESCCGDIKVHKGEINKYRVDIDKYTYPKVMENKKSKKYQYDMYDNDKLIKSFVLDKNENELLPFPESGENWGRFGTRDRGGDNWVNEKVCAALLGFFYSLPHNNYNEKLYFNDISAKDGRNIGHAGHNIAGNDVDIRYPGSSNGGQTFWRDAMKTYGTEEKFVKVLENIISIGIKWGFSKNYAYKSNIKNTTGKATSVHQDHFHLGLR